MKPWARRLVVRAATLAMGSLALGAAALAADVPNVVIIFIDDLGYADVRPFGDPAYATPNLDRMAAEGRAFTDFQVSSAVCSASRAGLMTGCYHTRVGIRGALGPQAEIGINASELTLAELCRQRGYATACVGKWHLGHHPKFLPAEHGFDAYFGLPYSNDMWPYHPDVLKLPMEERVKRWPPLPLIEGRQVVDAEVTTEDQRQLTRQYTEHAVDFIRANRERPFFLYLAHSMVHVPLHVSEAFDGASGQGLFGDVMAEVDWSVGQVLSTLTELGLDEKTLVVFTSDNGPWLSYGAHAGSSAPLREGKGTSFEGGFRVPCLMRWPGRIPPGTTCGELAATIDLLPTVAALIGRELPAHPIDGKDIGPLMFGADDAKSPHDYFLYYYEDDQLQAIRDRQWKLHFPHGYRTLAGRVGRDDGQPINYEQTKIGLALFDLKQDREERVNVAGEHPEIVARLQHAAEETRTALGDSLTKRVGAEVRPAGNLAAGDARFESLVRDASAP